MTKTTLLVGMLLLAAADAQAQTARAQLETCAERGCGWGRTIQNDSGDTTGAPDREKLAVDESRKTKPAMDEPPSPDSPKPAKKKLPLGKLALGLGAALLGGYVGATGHLPFGLGATFGFALLGAGLGLLLAFVLVPKIMGLLHRKKAGAGAPLPPPPAA
jgi:hypothetical protein